MSRTFLSIGNNYPFTGMIILGAFEVTFIMKVTSKNPFKNNI